MRGKALITYTDSRDNVFDLMTDGVRRINKASFHEYSWDKDVTDTRFGEKLRAWKKSAAQYSVTIYFDGDKREKNLNEFHDALEYDIINNEPGTLRWEDYTIECFGISSKTYPAEEKFGSATANDVVFYCPYPFWKKTQLFRSYRTTDRPEMDVYLVSDNPFTFTNAQGQTVIPEQGYIYTCKTDGAYFNKQFISINDKFVNITPDYLKAYGESYDYKYDYKIDFESYFTIYNTNILGSSYIAVIYGPCVNPYIILANEDPYADDVHISINTKVPAGGRLVVDMTDKTVFKYLRNGSAINCFGQRNLDAGYLWTKVPYGVSRVIWDGTFDFDLLLIEERSEPKWLLG